MAQLKNSFSLRKCLLRCLLVGLLLPLQSWAQNPAGPSWQSLHFEAQKLFVRGEFSIALSEMDSAQMQPPLLSIPEHAALQPCQAVLRLDAQMKLMSNRAKLQLWLDPSDLRMLQRSRFTQGGEQRLKTARFLDKGLWWMRREPDARTENAPPEQWPLVREKHIAFPVLETNPYWLDASSLLLLVSSPQLREQGAQLSVPVFTDQQPYQVRLKVAGQKRLPVDFRLKRGADHQRVDEKMSTLKIDVQATPLRKTDDKPEFNLLGLTGEISIYMDVKRGIPVMVEGDAGSRGRLKIRLAEALLKPVARAEQVTQSCDRSPHVIWR